MLFVVADVCILLPNVVSLLYYYSLVSCLPLSLPSVYSVSMQLKAHLSSSVTTRLSSPSLKVTSVVSQPGHHWPGAHRLNTEPVREGRGVQSSSRETNTDIDEGEKQDKRKKEDNSTDKLGLKNGKKKKTDGQGEMKAQQETEGDGERPSLVWWWWRGTGRVGFIQEEVVYCVDEKSSAIRWWAISVCVSWGVHYYTSFLAFLHINLPLV